MTTGAPDSTQAWNGDSVGGCLHGGGMGILPYVYLALLPGDEHILIAIATLLGGAVDAAAGVDHVADQVPVGRVGR